MLPAAAMAVTRSQWQTQIQHLIDGVMKGNDASILVIGDGSAGTAIATGIDGKFAYYSRLKMLYECTQCEIMLSATCN